MAPSAKSEEKAIRALIAPVSPRTLDETVDFLERSNFGVANVRSRRLIRAICVDAMRERGPIVLRTEGGAVVAIRNAPGYWKRFGLRHPLVALGILLRRGFASARGSRIPQQKAGASELTATKEGDLASFDIGWNESRDDVARVVLIAIEPQARGRGVASEIYMALFDYLRESGTEAVIARIGADNTASLRLHRRTGWILGRQGTFWQALKRL